MVESHEARPRDPAALKSLAVSIFLPHSAMAVGQGATTPVIALLALELGASVAEAGLVVAMFGLGAFLADVPGGLIVARIGDRRTMALASGLMAMSALGAAFRPPLLILAVLIAAMGGSTAIFGIGRLAHATEVSPLNQRGRVMSSIGGVQRIGMFVGPLIGGLTIRAIGLNGPFLVHAGMGLVALISMVRTRGDPDGVGVRREQAPRPSLIGIVKDHRHILATAGIATVALQVVRSSREVIIPLWGDQIGLKPTQIAFLFSLAAGMEVLVFYPVGRLMDRRGRKWVAIPSLTLLSLGLMAIPLTSSAAMLGVVAAILGFANGMSTGINMTLSSDFSPTNGRSVFLGVWRMVSDAGTAGGPTLVAFVSALTGLALASMMVAGVGLSGVLLLWLMVPETLKRDS